MNPIELHFKKLIIFFALGSSAFLVGLQLQTDPVRTRKLVLSHQTAPGQTNTSPENELIIYFISKNPKKPTNKTMSHQQKQYEAKIRQSTGL
jgi:hypothetical protein